MWPRLDSGQLASMGGRKLGGFVAFLRRPDAERAAKEMDGAEWGNSTLKIGWGKAVPIPATALYGACPRVIRLRGDPSQCRSELTCCHWLLMARGRTRLRLPLVAPRPLPLPQPQPRPPRVPPLESRPLLRLEARALSLPLATAARPRLARTGGGRRRDVPRRGGKEGARQRPRV